MPPRIVRRLVLAPFMFVVSLVFLAASPVLLLGAAMADLFLSRWQWKTVRLTAFFLWYLLYEAIGLVWMFVLWVASGFGLRLRSKRMQDAHYGFMRWWLRGINAACLRLLRMRIRLEDRPEAQAGPILVFSRHAGPGNSLMLVGTIMIAYDRHPRVVMLAKLQWEPLFDVMLNRLPNRFIEHDPTRRDRHLRVISELAAGLGDRDAYILFPEGHDFTPHIRLRAIASLRRKGHVEQAEKAERLAYTLPPRHGGVMAAISGAPQADIVFVAHTVLEDVGSFRDLWNRIPFEKPILSRYWRIPPEEIPSDRDEMISWLFDWWSRIDAWIEERRSAIAVAGSDQAPVAGPSGGGRPSLP